jgi:outer membrane protein
MELKMKKMNLRKIINIAITLNLLAAFSIVSAQDNKKNEYSLEEAIDYALENNYDAVNSTLGIDAAKAQLREIVASGFPQISGSVEYNNMFEIPTQLIPGDFLDRPGEFIPVKFGVRHNATAGITVTQLLFSGSYIVGVQASNVYLDLQEQNNKRSELDVAQSVTQSYYLVLLVEENQRILGQSLENIKKIHYEVEEIFKEGFVEDIDVKQLQISVTQLKNSMNTLAQQLEVSYKLLKLQMGIDINENIKLTEKLENILQLVNISSLINSEFDMKKNIEFQLIESQVALSGLSLKNEWSKFLPTIAAFGTYQYNAMRDKFNLFDGDEDWFNTGIIGVKLELPIFNSGAKFFKVQQSRIELKQAENTKRKVEQALALQYSQVKSELKSNHDIFQNNKNNMQLSKEVFDKTLEKYKEGISSNLELIQVHNQYLGTQSVYFKSMSDLLNSKNSLDRLLNNY